MKFFSCRKIASQRQVFLLLTVNINRPENPLTNTAFASYLLARENYGKRVGKRCVNDSFLMRENC